MFIYTYVYSIILMFLLLRDHYYVKNSHTERCKYLLDKNSFKNTFKKDLIISFLVDACYVKINFFNLYIDYIHIYTYMNTFFLF
jgi:hypothetical protein